MHRARLTRRGLDNLVAFARLFGCVRHFHPGDEAVQADWDAFAIAGVQAVEQASGPGALAKELQRLFAPVAPAVRVWATGQLAPECGLGEPAATQPPTNISWRQALRGALGARTATSCLPERRCAAARA